ncbi:DUF4271 domain-containing protein [Echinicola strongylocentroti]|uniref:DUF4271 domain-containing protein n=1 Tax=Echinicola strongylocentroti TaxID=1795355 RepID=A0A2Z4IHC1_9BACT|nr:DUF4271 domain-containing protein [Echinicola strongylocentroti]AWW30335.1 DUF4271 domain-containing protein [Echinicola strongylocentroti]
MRKEIRGLIAAVCLFFLFGTLQAQVLENYNPRIVISEKYDLLPSPVMAAVDLDLETYPLASFQLVFPAETAVFLDNTLWFYASADTSFVLPLKRLKEISPVDSQSGTLPLRAYKEGIDKSQLSVKKGVFRKGKSVDSSIDTPSEQLRKKDPVKDFLIVALVVVLSLIALFKVTYPVIFQSALRPVTMFAEELSEGGSGIKTFSSDVIFYLLVFSMLMSLFTFSCLHFAGISLLDDYLVGGLNSLLLVWLSGTAFFMVLSFMKYLWIKFFAVVYQLDKVDFSQFFYLVRILMMVLLVMFIVLMGFYLQGYTKMDEMVEFALGLFLLVYLAGIFRLFYLMLKKVPFKSYHLFSYLCSSELVPFLVIVKLIVG